LAEWRSSRHQQPPAAEQNNSSDQVLIDAITAASLREKRQQGLPVSINELILVYRRHTHEYYRKHGKVTRQAEQIDEVLRFLRKQHGKESVELFGPVALDELRDQMIDDLDWSRKHINKQVLRLIGMFKWAAEKELTPPSVPMALRSLAGLKKGRTRARETQGVTCVDDAIVEKTLPYLPEVIADMVRLQRFTGARPGEICSLRPCDLDRSVEVWWYRPAEHKTEHHDKDRAIAVGPQAQQVLLPYLSRGPEKCCFSPRESEARRRRKAHAERVTPKSCGNTRGTNRVMAPKRQAADQYTTASYRRAIHRACENAGVEKWSPNRLRHTAATSIRKRFGIEAAQVICGHQTADVTQIYAERDMELATHVALEVG